MITFDVPQGFRDVSEYTLTDGQRSIIVREAGDIGSSEDLRQVGADYAAQLREMAGFASAEASELKNRSDSVPYVLVSARSDKLDGAVERAAFLRFANGLSILISMTSTAAADRDAASFEHLVESIRPAAESPMRRTIQDAVGAAVGTRRLGAVWLDLPGNYRDQTVPTFRDAAGTRQLTVDFANALTSSPPDSRKKLFGNLSEATDERGERFAFESPAKPSGERALSLRTAAADENATAVAEAVVGGKRIVVRMQSVRPDSDMAAIVEQTARSARSGS